jgi:hypothetical protein
MLVQSKPRRIPLAVKLAYLLWMVIWVPVYWAFNGPENFLWLCDLANIILLIALCRESSLLMSSQAVGVLLIQVAWVLDFLSALLLGSHLTGGTEYMFDTGQPSWLRAMSLFHIVMPPLLLWGVYRLGYDRRGWLLQIIIAWLLMAATFLLTDPSLNINWLRQPFGLPQSLLSPQAFLLFMMVAYILVVVLPTHLLLSQWSRRG